MSDPYKDFAMHPSYVLWAVTFLCFRPSTAVLFFSGAVTLFYTQYLGEPQTLPSGDGARAAR